MLLAIDAGNTTITLGLYDGERPQARWRLSTAPERTPDEAGLQLTGMLANAGYGPGDLEGICLASVVPPLTGVLQEACRQYLDQEALVVGVGVKTGLRIRSDYPQGIGADRIVDTVATRDLYGGPACVIDFGTATTFDALSARGEHLGGAIAPGVDVAAEALFRRAARLPQIDLQRPPGVIARNTVHAMQAGLLFGYVGLVEGIVGRFRAELGPEMKVIATGGLAGVIAAETDVIQVVNPWLTLEGLRIIWTLNR